MISRIKQLIHLREQDSLISKIIKGIHIEGPFINSELGYRGAHPEKYILKPDVEVMKMFNKVYGPLSGTIATIFEITESLITK